MMKHKPIWFALLLAGMAAAPVYAETAQQLQTIEVRGKRVRTKAAVERKNQAAIATEMIRDNRDLVRYSTDAGISDSGRHQKGFAMRGVEGNRVGISIDGVNIPDSEENTVYARYGNFNSSRLAIDPELVRSIDVVKGADSFDNGSGALGGGVNYRTLEARDLIRGDKNIGLYLKSGYGSRNREWTNTVGIGADNGRVDMALLYSQRRGHETESYGERGRTVVGAGSGTNIYGAARGIPDPAKHRYHNFLAKIGFQINENHRIGASVNGQQGHNYTIEESYSLWSGQWREADDETRRRTANLFYEYTPDSMWLERLKIDADYQKTQVGAVNYKGTYPWDWSAYPATRNWSNKELEEVYNRQMYTRFARLSLRADSRPLQWGGEHRLSFKLFGSTRKTENNNIDDYYFSNQIDRSNYTIQYPVKTKNFGFSLQDNIQWNTVFNSRFGVRYDHTKTEPQDLTVVCNNCAAEKPAANTFKGWTGFAGLGVQLNKTWRVEYDLAGGYRVPSASEMYFTFNNGAATWVANPDLKPERSLNHTLSLRGRGEKGTLDLSLYQTNYRHFLSEEQYVEEIPNRYYYPGCDFGGWITCNPTESQLYWHMQNFDKARIRGVEFTGKLNLDKVTPLPEGWKLFGALGYAKSRLSGDSSLLSTQPLKAIVGLDYESPSQKWGVFSRLTYMGAKKPKDAQYIVYDGSRTAGFTKVVETYPWLNKSAYVFDLYGFYKPVDQLTVRAGVYNLFNRKYHTWDSLRGIYSYSTTNAVDRDNKGLARFYAPGRNYAVSLEYRF